MTATKTLRDLAETVRLIVKPGEAKTDWDKRDEWQQNANDYRLTLVYGGRRFSFDYWQGVGIKTEPETACVLDSLLSDATACDMGFSEWCDEYGYDTDSRKAVKLWKACRRIGRRLRKLLGADYETFASADRN